MKQAINTRTQEEYDALMEWCKKNNYTWPGESLATDFNAFSRTGKETGICIGHVYPNKIGWMNIRAFENLDIPIIPYTEFAKANITESPNYEERYREAVKLLEWTKQVCSNIQRTKTYGTKFPETATLGNAIDDFLTNHKDGE